MQSFKEFWPFYLREHSNAYNRLCHFEGTFLALLCVLISALSGKFSGILVAIVVGYGFAWAGHFFFQKNRPATFKYPLWSLLGDIKMFLYFVTGQLPEELKKHLPQ